MEIHELTVEQVQRYEADLRVLLKQSFAKSFPDQVHGETEISNRIDRLKNYLRVGKAHIVAVFAEARLIGFIWFFEKEKAQVSTIHVNHLVVHEEYRGKGIGKTLLENVERYARQRGIEQLELLVTMENKPAVGFYTKRGFEIERLVMTKRV